MALFHLTDAELDAVTGAGGDRAVIRNVRQKNYSKQVIVQKADDGSANTDDGTGGQYASQDSDQSNSVSISQ